MQSEQVRRGKLKLAGAPAVLSHVRLSVNGHGGYDEVGIRTAGLEWNVLASFLNEHQAAAVFAAVNETSVDRAGDLDDTVREAVSGAR